MSSRNWREECSERDQQTYGRDQQPYGRDQQSYGRDQQPYDRNNGYHISRPQWMPQSAPYFQGSNDCYLTNSPYWPQNVQDNYYPSNRDFRDTNTYHQNEQQFDVSSRKSTRWDNPRKNDITQPHSSQIPRPPYNSALPTNFVSQNTTANSSNCSSSQGNRNFSNNIILKESSINSHASTELDSCKNKSIHAVNAPPHEKNKEEVAHPGSEAAREKKIAAITRSLMRINQEQEISGDNQISMEKDDIPSTESANKTKIPNKEKYTVTKKSNVVRKPKRVLPVDIRSGVSKNLLKKKPFPDFKRFVATKTTSLSINSTSTEKGTAKTSCLRPISVASPSKRKLSTSDANSLISKKHKEVPMSKENSTSATPNDPKMTDEYKQNISKKLLSMGKSEIQNLINNPHSSKSQSIMQALMKMYREMQAQKFDQRRFGRSAVSPTPNTTSSNLLSFSPSSSFTHFPSRSSPKPVDPNSADAIIEMADLPNEIVNQIERFLGCELSGTSNSTLSSLIAVSEPDNHSHYTTSHDMMPIIGTNFPPLIGGNINQNWNGNSTENVIPPIQTDLAPALGISMIDDVNKQDSTTGNSSDRQNCLPTEYGFNPNCPLTSMQNIEFLTRDGIQGLNPQAIINELQIIDAKIQYEMNKKVFLYGKLQEYFEKQAVQKPRVSVRTAQSLTETTQPDVENSTLNSMNGETTVPICENTMTVNASKSQSNDVLQNINNRELQQLPVVNALLSDSDENKCPSCRGVDVPVEKLDLTALCKAVSVMVVYDEILLLAGSNRIVYCYNMKSGELFKKLKGHEAKISSLLALKLQDTNQTLTNHIMTGSSDENLRIFNLKNGVCNSKHYVASTIECLVESEKLVYLGLSCGNIMMYYIDTDKLNEIPFDCGNHAVTAIAVFWKGKNKMLLVATQQQFITMRNAETGLLVCTIKSSWTLSAYSLVVQGNILFCGESSKGIPYYNLKKNEKEGCMEKSTLMTCMQMYRGLLFAGSCNGKIYVFDSKTKKLNMTVHRPTDQIISHLAIQDNVLISCSQGGKITASTLPPELTAQLWPKCCCHVKS